MNEEQAKKLREEFPASQVGKLPKGNVTLDYVGHGAVTDRLLEVDPDWNWEPLSVDEDGFPKLDTAGNLWIKLTVGGVTRLGVGDGATMKVLIGDALRNAAMRFGVALDLWIRGHAEDDEQRAPEPPRQRPPQAPVVPSVPLASAETHQALRNSIEGLDVADKPGFLAWWKDQKFPSIKTQDSLSEAQADLAFDHIDSIENRPFREMQDFDAAERSNAAEAATISGGVAGTTSATPDAATPSVTEQALSHTESERYMEDAEKEAAGAPDVSKTDEEENLDYFQARGMLSPEEEENVRTGGSPATARRVMEEAKARKPAGARK